MFIMPTRGRPHLIPRFFSKAPPTHKGILAVDADDAANYEGIELPAGWGRFVSPRCFVSQKLNEVFAAFPSEPFYGVIMDDTIPETAGWDAMLVERAGPRGIAWSDDCLPGKRPSALVMGGELARALGWFSCPALKHFYTDNVWEKIAEDLGCVGRCEDIKVPHLHHSAGAPYDKTYAERPAAATDAINYRRWLALTWPELKNGIDVRSR